MRAKLGWLLISALLGVAGVGIIRQRNVASALRIELDRESDTARALAAARAEQEALLAAQPALGERLAAGLESLFQARAELAALRREAEQSERAIAEKHSSSSPRFSVGSTVAAAAWRNAGSATPQATLETALWAAAGGDVEAFAMTFLFMGGPARQAGQALLEGLPEAMRVQYGSPERLIAFLSVQDVPLGSAQVRQFNVLEGWPAPAAHVQLLLRDADGKARDTNLLFMNPGDGWKLVVTDGVVAKYAKQLRNPPKFPAEK